MAATVQSTAAALSEKVASLTDTTAPVSDEPTMNPTTNSSAPVSMSYFPQYQSEFKPPLIANENAFLGDVAESTDKDKPISCGFYRLEKGTPLVYTYTYHEMKIIVDGHFYISDETGKKVRATKGDVFYFPKGATITFTTDDFGLAFYTGQRAEGAA